MTATENARFEAAVDAVVSGDAETLRAMLAETPELVRARSTRAHHATLLHYVAANGVEDERQKTPPNAVEIATMLLDAGADVDARADMYGTRCTTMSMLVSSVHPAEAGLQIALAELLMDRGAEPDVLTALTFGYLETAQAMVRRGAKVGGLAMFAGLGRVDDVARLLPSADERTRHVAFALATQLGQTEVVRMLLDAGEDANRFNPEGVHPHATALHQAVWNDRIDVVRLLVERGARLDLRDTIHNGTPLDWATYGGRSAIAEYLRGATGMARMTSE